MAWISARRVMAAIAMMAFSGAAWAADLPVKVGISNTSSDVGIFIAAKEGYFHAEGISVTTVPFNSAAQMIAPLGIDEIDVGSGSAAAGLYNAVSRGIRIRIVADGGSAPPGYGHNILLVRKALVASGRYKGPADLKGMHVALTSEGTASTAMINTFLQKAGLKFSDIDPIYLGYPDHIVALANGRADAALTAEPSATQAVDAGSAVRITSEDQFDPYHVASVILFAGDFADKQKDAAMRFMRAYVRAIRFYNDALKGGKLAGPNAEEVIQVLTDSTRVKNPQVYRDISPQGCDPNGIPNRASLQADLDFYRSQGWVKGEVNLDQAVDLSFVKAADKALGPYSPASAR